MQADFNDRQRRILDYWTKSEAFRKMLLYLAW